MSMFQKTFLDHLDLTRQSDLTKAEVDFWLTFGMPISPPPSDSRSTDDLSEDTVDVFGDVLFHTEKNVLQARNRLNTPFFDALDYLHALSDSILKEYSNVTVCNIYSIHPITNDVYVGKEKDEWKQVYNMDLLIESFGIKYGQDGRYEQGKYLSSPETKFAACLSRVGWTGSIFYVHSTTSGIKHTLVIAFNGELRRKENHA